MKLIKISSNILYVFPFFLLSLVSTACDTNDSGKIMSERETNFNYDWKFIKQNIPEASNTEYDDSNWRTVDLPHDWSIEDLPVQDSNQIGPFDKSLENGKDVGFLRGGNGWYRKNLVIPNQDKDKQFILNFDGVQSQSELWVNGKKVGENIYGYTPFNFNITPFLNLDGTKNIIAVKVVNPEQNSRWYAGSGIYRNVKLIKTNSIFINDWSVFIKTPAVNDRIANVELDLNVDNKSGIESEITIEAKVFTPKNELISFNENTIIANPNSKTESSHKISITNPELWDIDSPKLHNLQITLKKDNKVLDVYKTSFGIRSIDFSAEKGFLLNGREVLMKGSCMHHDNGILGAAAFEGAEERRVSIMKSNGYNAIRTSHNPPSTAFLNACDRLGMLVIDETFDQWQKPKRPNDYHLYFDDWWENDTKAMILRDRNHPSVIMWSIGNEIPERADSSGLAIASAMKNYINTLDTTRPITHAICDFWDNPGKEWNYSAPAFDLLDVGGYNYKWDKYEEDHEKYPNRIMYGSETFPKEAYENWKLVEKHPYIIGDFVWTGMDYLGEAGLGNSIYTNDNSTPVEFQKPFPWFNAWCGDIDIIGNKKPQSFYRDVLWGESKLEIAVHEPIPDGKVEGISYWGWRAETKSWNWKGLEGKLLEVNVYSTYPKIRLELNGNVIAEKDITEESKLTAAFKVAYTEGELKAIALVDNQEVESKSIITTSQASSIELKPESNEFNADKNEIIFIPIEIKDKNGLVIPDGIVPLEISVDGPGKLIAFGNGSPLADGSFQDNKSNSFRGKALAIIRSTGEKGNLKVKVIAGTELSVEVSIEAK